MKKSTRFRNAFTAFAALAFTGMMHAQTPVVVPGDLVPINAANAAVSGWRMHSTGNSSAQLVEVADYSIPANFGPHSIRASRTGGTGLNRSYVGYYTPNKKLSDLERFSWFRYTENGTDTYLNIFITNGSARATVVYMPAVSSGIWQESVYNNSVSGNLYIRTSGNSGTNMQPITYAQLMNQYGNWNIYNHPESFIGNFIGGIVMVSGSSSPTAPQTHSFDMATVKFAGQDAQSFDFVKTLPPHPPLWPCSASEVILYEPAKQQDGSDIPAAYADPNMALSEPQDNDNSPYINAVSLGFGGTLVLKMSNPIKNGPGNDFKVFETSGGLTSAICQKHPERIMAFASQDGCNWVYAGTGCQDVEFDLGELNWASYIKLIDVSPINGIYQGEIVPNGYDVDGVVCLNGYETDPVMQDLGAFYAMGYSDFNQGFRRNGSAVPADRSNPANILGEPQNNHTVNFVSLGFGGSIILELGYVVFDKPGNDIKIVETSFGNPSCTSYPEKASVEVSLDKNQWITLGATLCQDGTLDLGMGGVKAVKYLRVTDRTLASKFNGTADGYDIDGVVVLQPGCTLNPNAITESPSVGTADEPLLSLIHGPNADLYYLSAPDEVIASRLSYKITNLAGQTLSEGVLNTDDAVSSLPLIRMEGLQTGIYFVTVNSDQFTETIKLLKR